MVSPCLLILEDDDARVTRFTSSLRQIDNSVQIEVWRSAKEMVQEIDPHLGSACLISLDHDLEPSSGQAPDPGDGLDVAKFLAGRSPCCPVIVHSSNLDRSYQMAGVLEAAGWTCKRVLPFGDDWIEQHWSFLVREILEISAT